MVSTNKENILAVLSLSGGNDGLNTVIPFNEGLYRDYRPTLSIPENQIIPLNDQIGLHPTMAPLKRFWDEGKLAIFLGIGYPNPSYSHFRSMDIWHTCEPDKIGTEGWLGQVIKEIDPNSENVLTGVNFGRGLPRALAKEGVPVASVGDLETYGLLTGIDGDAQRSKALDVFTGTLNDRQKDIFLGRIANELEGKEKKCANTFGVTKQRVGQIEKDLRGKFARHLSNTFGDTGVRDMLRASF